MNSTSDDLLPLLKVHEYFQGVSDDALREVVRLGRLAQHAPGTIVHEANAPLTQIGFVLRGRLKAVHVDAHGTESLFRTIERGGQFGMMIGALGEPVPIRVVALEASTVLRLDFDEALDLTFRYPELRRLWLTTFAGNLQRHFFGAAPARAPMMLALVHDSPETRSAARRLVARLSSLGESLAVFSDAADWKIELPDVRFRPLHTDGRTLEVDEIRAQAAEWHDARRIVFDVGADLPADATQRLMELADRAVWFVPARSAEAALGRLKSLGGPERGWRDKTNIAWLVDAARPVAPVVPHLGDLAYRDFKIPGTPPAMPWGRSVADGLERLVHDLRGVRIGVALGGGAARGMSHLGVLKALEQNGIVVDAIAGTSAGAMTGIVYSSGLDPDYCAARFGEDLRPNWLFRHLPGGKHWYLVHKYRTGQFDPMLRKYLHDWRLEQLPVPCVALSVDLVNCESVVRDRGDAIHAILESINLPVLSVPICRGGQALVDGGIVNNLPANVLASMGCNFVIAVSVTAKLERRFCEISPDRPTGRARPSAVQTLLRTLVVQNHCLNATSVQPADFMIEPDVTGFDLTEFERTPELAAVGEAAALETIPRIRRLLARLDPQLFAENDGRVSK